jgi:hypothetical protein
VIERPLAPHFRIRRRSVGTEADPAISGLPHDPWRGVVPNDQGRIISPDGAAVRGAGRDVSPLTWQQWRVIDAE